MVKINRKSSKTIKRSKVKKTRKCNNKQRGGARGQALPPRNSIHNHTPYQKKQQAKEWLYNYFMVEKSSGPKKRLDKLKELEETVGFENESNFVIFDRIGGPNKSIEIFDYLKILNIKTIDDFNREILHHHSSTTEQANENPYGVYINGNVKNSRTGEILYTRKRSGNLSPPRPYKRPSITRRLMPELFNNSRSQRRSHRRSRNSEKKPIIVFDFDKTFIEQHSGGVPISNRTENLQPQIIKNYRDYLTIIKNKFSKIYINSRGISDEIKRYLFNNGHIDEYIDDFYGANERSEIGQKSNNNIRNTSNPDSYWSKRKVRNLNDILLHNPGYRKTDIYFYDDTELNITEAIAAGYINSFVVPSSAPNSVSHLYPQLKGGEKLLAKIASGDLIIQGRY